MLTGDVIEVVLRGEYAGHPMGHHLHFEIMTDGLAESDLFNALDASTSVLKTLCDNMSNKWFLPAVTTRKVFPDLGVMTSWAPTHNQGTLGAGIGIMQLAIVASLRTGEGGRAKRGRMYLATYFAAQLSNSVDGSWHIDPLNQARAVTDKFMDRFGPTGFFAADYRWTIFSKRYSLSTKITQVLTHVAIGTVRRRSIIDVGH
jgi:hypothetical protein